MKQDRNLRKKSVLIGSPRRGQTVLEAPVISRDEKETSRRAMLHLFSLAWAATCSRNYARRSHPRRTLCSLWRSCRIAGCKLERSNFISFSFNTCKLESELIFGRCESMEQRILYNSSICQATSTLLFVAKGGLGN